MRGINRRTVVAALMANTEVYGRCPECLGIGVSRERRPDGNDTCANGHMYPSRDAITRPAASERRDSGSGVQP